MVPCLSAVQDLRLVDARNSHKTRGFAAVAAEFFYMAYNIRIVKNIKTTIVGGEKKNMKAMRAAGEPRMHPLTFVTGSRNSVENTKRKVIIPRNYR